MSEAAFRVIDISVRRESVLRAEMKRTDIPHKRPFSYTRTDSWVLFPSRHYSAPVRMTQISRRRTNMPASSRVSKLVHKDTCQIFPFHPHSTPLSLSRFTYFRPKLSRACQLKSILFGYLLAFHCRPHPSRVCLKTSFYAPQREIRSFSPLARVHVLLFFILIFIIFFAFYCYQLCTSFIEYALV